MRKLLLILPALALSIGLAAQHPGWTNYTNGNACRMLACEGDHVWVATSGGLARIDRHNLEVAHYNHANSSLPFNNIHGLAMDAEGVKWLYGSYSGLVRDDGNAITTYYPAEIYNSFNSIRVAGPDDIWLGSDVGGFFHFDGTDFTQYRDWTDDSTPNSDALTIDLQGRIWFSTYDSVNLTGDLVCYDGEGYTFYNPQNSGLPLTAVCDMAFDADNHLWAGTFDNGIVHFDGSAWTQYNTANSGLAGNFIASLNLHPNGDVYVGTHLGLSVFDGTDWTTYNTSNSPLQSNYVYDMAVDADGDVWLATGMGVARIQNGVMQVILTSNSGLPNYPIFDQVTDANGVHWFATFSGLYRFDGIQWSFIDPPGTEDTIYGIDLDSAGNLWLALRYGGVMKYDGNSFTEYTIYNSPLPNHLMQDIAVDSQDRVWIASQINGLFCLDGDNWTVYNTGNSILPNDHLLTVRVDAADRVWACASYGSSQPGGVVKIEGNQWTLYNAANSGLPSDIVYDVRARDGGVWFATPLGLALLQGTEWTVFGHANSGLPTDMITDLAFDSDGDLWIGAYNQGIVKFDGQEWTVFTAFTSGLSSNFMDYVYVDPGDKVWIGHYSGGISVYDNPAVEGSDPVLPPASLALKASPNPFVEEVKLEFNLEQPSPVELSGYNLRGQKLFSISYPLLGKGRQVLGWDGRDDNGNRCAPGVYILRLKAEGATQARKVLLAPKS
jgi:ligand-binding sensor domain-containing protein